MNRLTARTILISFAALALAGCGVLPGGENSLDSLDAELLEIGNADNPAVTEALNEPIMVDPSLASQSNADSIRPPTKPYSAAVPPEKVATRPPVADENKLMSAPAAVSAKSCPQCEAANQSLTPGALAASQGSARCAANIKYSASWAQRLPADLPLYPDARVSEAAGTDGGSCGLRVVSFSSEKPMQYLLNWYYTRVSKAGFNAEHQSDGVQHVLGGTRQRDGMAFVLFMTDRAGGGTDIDMVVNHGR